MLLEPFVYEPAGVEVRDVEAAKELMRDMLRGNLHSEERDEMDEDENLGAADQPDAQGDAAMEEEETPSASVPRRAQLFPCRPTQI